MPPKGKGGKQAQGAQPGKGKKNNKRKSKGPRSNMAAGLILPPRSARQPPISFVKGSYLPRPMMRVRVVREDGIDHLIVSGTEIFQSLVGASIFTQRVNQFINPLNDVLFPKASAMAALYEKWRPYGKGFRFYYIPACPVTRTGNHAGYVETDPGDTQIPTSTIEMVNQMYSTAGPVYDAAEIRFPPSEDSNLWYFVQGSTDTTDGLTNRSAMPGILYWYAENASAESPTDDGLFNGYLAMDYEIELSTFRPPDSTGFTLVNNTDVTLPDTIASPLQLSDNTSVLNLGARALRYVYDSVKPVIGGLTPNTLTNRYLLYPPLKKNTPLAITANFDNTSAEDTKGPKRSESKSRGSLVVPDFKPWMVTQDDDGNWFYQDYPDDEFHPFPSEGVQVRTPQAVGDITFYITYTTLGSGTETVLYTTSVSAVLTAVAVSLGGIVSPSVTGYLKVYAQCASTAGRILTALTSVIGGGGGGGGDIPALRKRRPVEPRYDYVEVKENEDGLAKPKLIRYGGSSKE